MFRYSSVALSLDFIRPRAWATVVISLVLMPSAAPASPMVDSTGRMLFASYPKVASVLLIAVRSS